MPRIAILLFVVFTLSACNKKTTAEKPTSPDTNPAEIKSTEVNPSPTVSCELMYNKRNADGTTADFRRGEVVSTKIEGQSSNSAAASTNGDFRLKVDLQRICETDGGPCTNNFELSIILTRDGADAESLVKTRINSQNAEIRDRVSTALSIGNEQGFSNCDIE